MMIELSGGPADGKRIDTTHAHTLPWAVSVANPQWHVTGSGAPKRCLYYRTDRQNERGETLYDWGGK